MIKNKKNKIFNLLNLFKYPLITIKSIHLLKFNKYTFLFNRQINKISIKKILEYLFNVKIIKINTLNLLKKKGYSCNFTIQYKKAIITLKDGHKIKLFFDI